MQFNVRARAAPGLALFAGAVVFVTLLMASGAMATGSVATGSPTSVFAGATAVAAPPTSDAPDQQPDSEPSDPTDGNERDGDDSVPTTVDTSNPDTTTPDTSTPAADTPDTVQPGLPGTAPPGFSEEQYRRFVDSVVVCGLDGGRVCEWVLSWTGNAGLAEASQWVVDVPLKLAAVFGLALLANRLVRRAVLRQVTRARTRRASDDALQAPDPERARRDAQRSATVASTLGGAATVAIFVIASLVALAELGLNIGPLLAGAGIVGIALGFGAQNLVRDVLAGVFVITEDQYGVGDIIDVGRTSGTVEGITLRITKVRDINGTLWFVPNGVVSEVGNLTQLWSRAIIDFDIDYRADHERAGEIIKATADQLWRDGSVRILDEPELWGVERLGDSSVVIRLAVKTAPAEQWKVARLLRSEVKKALDAEGIDIPFPQHTIWVHGDPEVVSAIADSDLQGSTPNAPVEHEVQT
jgi:moderate conductance mechanosensitive channel